MSDEYERMYHSLATVEAAVQELRKVLPPPGEPVRGERLDAVGRAERALLTNWAGYLYAYDAVYRR